MRLKNKVALITGGTSGIGRATAELFAAEGAQVALTGRRNELGEAVAAQIHGLYIYADHRRAEDCQQAVEQTLAAFGRIDILFNNAGIVVAGTAETTSEQDWQDTLDLNVTGVWRMSRLVVPHMRRQGGGAIVNNASDWGLVGAPGVVAYCASKGAVIQITRRDGAGSCRRGHPHQRGLPGRYLCGALAEGWILSLLRRSEPKRRRARPTCPSGGSPRRWRLPKRCSSWLRTIASFVTGTALVVDGGNTAR